MLHALLYYSSPCGATVALQEMLHALLYYMLHALLYYYPL